MRYLGEPLLEERRRKSKERGKEEAGPSPGEDPFERLRGRQRRNPAGRPKERRVSESTIIARWGGELRLDPITEWVLAYHWHSGNQRPEGCREFPGTPVCIFCTED